jgi:hypothetical protein
MTPSAAIRASVALSLLASAYSLVMIGVYLFRVAPSAGAAPSIIVGVLLQAVLAVWGAVNATGLSRRRQWVRTSVLFFAGVLVFLNLFGSLGALIVFFMLPEGSLKTAGMTAELLPRAALALAGIWWLVVFNRQPLRGAFSPR